MTKNTLVLSDKPGCYTIGIGGQDLIEGQKIEVNLGGRWIPGVIRHSKDGDHGIYASATGSHRGYYVVLITKESCGLYTGMVFRIANGQKKAKTKR